MIPDKLSKVQQSVITVQKSVIKHSGSNLKTTSTKIACVFIKMKKVLIQNISLTDTKSDDYSWFTYM